jgi:hypothetical protein
MIFGGHASLYLAISGLLKPVVVVAALSMMFLLLWNLFFIVRRGVCFLLTVANRARIISLFGLICANVCNRFPAYWIGFKG